jgi:hypothetical protein
MIRNARTRGLVGSLFVAVAAAISGWGCASFWNETAPVWDLAPRMTQPGGYRDWKESGNKGDQQVKINPTKLYFHVPTKKWMYIDENCHFRYDVVELDGKLYVDEEEIPEDTPIQRLCN